MNIEILIFAVLLIIFFWFILILIDIKNGKKDQKNYILSELKTIKELFVYQNEYEYPAKGRIIGALMVGLLILLINSIILYYTDYTGNIIEFIGTLLMIIMFDVFLIVFIYCIINNGVKNIQIKDNLLIIKYDKSIKKYEIKDIDELKTKISYGSKRSFLYLYIKNKNENKYDEYFLSLYSETKIIALIIFIGYIKQNKIEYIDTVSLEYIEKLKTEIKNLNIKDNKIQRIV